MQQYSASHWERTGSLEVLTFDLGSETFALEAAMVREIIDLLPETRVPGAASMAGSIVNFRGKIIPIVDLRLAFCLPEASRTTDSRIIVIELFLGEEPIPLGIRADRVNEVTSLPHDGCEEIPVVGMRWPRNHVRALVRSPLGVVVLPDLAAIFHTLLPGEDDASSAIRSR